MKLFNEEQLRQIQEYQKSPEAAEAENELMAAIDRMAAALDLIPQTPDNPAKEA